MDRLDLKHFIHRRGLTLFPAAVPWRRGRWKGVVDVLVTSDSERVTHYCVGTHGNRCGAIVQAQGDAAVIAGYMR
jgi:hypothetical protein